MWGRGLASGDLDNDGRVDAVVISQDENLTYLHNQTETGHFLVLQLQGIRCNRDAVGAKVTIQAGKRLRMTQRVGGGSYQSASDSRVQFGLGAVQNVEQVEIRWPSGQIDRHEDLAADAGYKIVERTSQPLPLKGWRLPPRPLPKTPVSAK